MAYNFYVSSSQQYIIYFLNLDSFQNKIFNVFFADLL